MGDQTRPDESPRPAPELRLEPARPRSRLRQALVCPYCRDAVTRQGTVACARRGCGALYHRECWEECARSYGGCAVYGCESKTSKEVSAAGYALRLVRLLVAAILFPPRVVRALRQRAAGETTVWRQGAAMALSYPIPLFAGGAFLALVLAVVSLYYTQRVRHWSEQWVFAIVPLSVMVTPFLFALGLGVGLVSLQTLAAVLRSEFAALARADDGGATVLGRLAKGTRKS